MRWIFLLLCLASCAPRSSKRELHVAAAANLAKVLGRVDTDFEKRTGIHVIPSFGSTAQLTQQIENGAPYDLFLAADVEHIDLLVRKGLGHSRILYARGSLALWVPKRPDIRSVQDLARSGVRTVVIAKPELAPYGQAAVETLLTLKLWDAVRSKVVYAQNISAAKEYADTGNGDAAFTALALVAEFPERLIVVPEHLHRPIDQAACLLNNAPQPELGRRFQNFLLGSDGAEILKRFGYGTPKQNRSAVQ